MGSVVIKGLTSGSVTIKPPDSGNDVVITTPTSSGNLITDTMVAGFSAPTWNNITGTPTTLAGYGITDPVVKAYDQWVDQSADGNVNSQVTTAIFRAVLTTTTANQIIDSSWSGIKYAGKYFIHISNGTNHQCSEVAVLTNKTVAVCTEYNVMTVPSTLILATFDVNSSGTLLITPTQTGDTVVHIQRMNMY